jgi:predicted MFS family arabinose efflux permease
MHLFATLLAFGAGWVWPVFTNFGVVRANQDSAAAATGITQTGVYIGVFLGPLVTGWIIERSGYPTMWIVVAGVMVLGALITMTASRNF